MGKQKNHTSSELKPGVRSFFLIFQVGSGTQAPGPFPLLSSLLAGSWIESGKPMTQTSMYMGFWHCRQQLYPLSHSTSPNYTKRKRLRVPYSIPLSMGHMYHNPQWISETLDTTEPCMYTLSFPVFIFTNTTSLPSQLSPYHMLWIKHLQYEMQQQNQQQFLFPCSQFSFLSKSSLPFT